MFDQIMKFFKKFSKEEKQDSKETAKERLHLVLMQDRANVSADFMELMKQEIIEVIKKYINIDENLIDVKLTNKVNSDGTTGAPMLYANIPILNVKDDTKQFNIDRTKKEENNQEEKEEALKEEIQENIEENNKEEIVEEKDMENIEENTQVQQDETINQEIEQTIIETNSIEQNNENIETSRS